MSENMEMVGALKGIQVARFVEASVIFNGSGPERQLRTERWLGRSVDWLKAVEAYYGAPARKRVHPPRPRSEAIPAMTPEPLQK